jgi:hypothetical protein
MIFFKKLRNIVKDLYVRVNYIENKISNIQYGVDIPGTVDCEGCGCRVRQEYAKKGKSEVRIKKQYHPFFGCMKDSEFIFTPFWCKRCAPKDED